MNFLVVEIELKKTKKNTEEKKNLKEINLLYSQHHNGLCIVTAPSPAQSSWHRRRCQFASAGWEGRAAQ